MYKPISDLIYFCFFLTIGIGSSPVSGTKNCEFPAIFNFGDSNSDTGGFSASYFQTPPPYGKTFFHMPAGRESDGRLIIDFIAESMDLPYLSAYLDSMGTNFSHGVNFVVSASTITPQDRGLSEGGFSPFYLDVQFGQFMQFKSRSKILKARGGIFAELMPEEEYFGKALYTLDIGQNDLGAGFLGNMSVDQVNASVPNIVSRFSANIKNIYGLGGRSFWIHNTGPIGCLPYILANLPITADQMDDAGCAKPYNNVAEYFNHKLKEAIIQLRKDLPLAAITYVDIYSIKYSVFSQPKKYGFEHPLVACCGYGGKYNYSSSVGCGGMAVNGTQLAVGSCDNPSVRVNWDGIHYTEAANKFVFDQISTGKFSDPPHPFTMPCPQILH